MSKSKNKTKLRIGEIAFFMIGLLITMIGIILFAMDAYTIADRYMGIATVTSVSQKEMSYPDGDKIVSFYTFEYLPAGEGAEHSYTRPQQSGEHYGIGDQIVIYYKLTNLNDVIEYTSKFNINIIIIIAGALCIIGTLFSMFRKDVKKNDEKSENKILKTTFKLDQKMMQDLQVESQRKILKEVEMVDEETADMEKKNNKSLLEKKLEQSTNNEFNTGSLVDKPINNQNTYYGNQYNQYGQYVQPYNNQPYNQQYINQPQMQQNVQYPYGYNYQNQQPQNPNQNNNN